MAPQWSSFIFLQLQRVLAHPKSATREERAQPETCSQRNPVRLNLVHTHLPFLLAASLRTENKNPSEKENIKTNQKNLSSFFRKLPRFIKLTDQMLLASFYRLSRESLVRFVTTVMRTNPCAQRKALFETSLHIEPDTGSCLSCRQDELFVKSLSYTSH